MNVRDYTGPHRFNMTEWISRAPFEKLLAMEIVEADAGRAILKMPFYQNFAQGAGLMHGGALVSLADTAVVMAIKSVVPPETHFATISLESRFHHPVKRGILLAKAAVVERQGSILKGSCDVFDEAERLVMTFASVFKIAKDSSIRDICFDGTTVQPDNPGA